MNYPFDMKIFEVDFKPMWPVPYGLIIAAKSEQEAILIAMETIKHSTVDCIKEVDISEPTVIFYESGDY